MMNYLVNKTFEHSSIYRIFHKFTGLYKLHAKLIETCSFSNRQTSKILDLGCGPGDTFNLLPNNIAYVGIDNNLKYIESAKKYAHPNATFLYGDVTEINPSNFSKFDLIIIFGLIHHLDNEKVEFLLSRSSQMLNPNGNIITLDGCYRNNISSLTKFMLNHDRGRYVRFEQDYIDLITNFFTIREVFTDTSLLHIPYAIISIKAQCL